MQKWFESIHVQLAKYITGQERNTNLILSVFLSRGHAILQGMPGTGKTFLVKLLGRLLGLSFQRIQFTPDLLPSDIIGYSIYRKDTGKMNFQKGPLFAQVVLADEINRTAPKTQAALLEAMEEGQVTAEGESYILEKPFLVLATQNPIELAGTYPLPEAQLDRFTALVKTDIPNSESEKKIYMNSISGVDGRQLDLSTIKPVTNAKEILSLQKQLTSVTVEEIVVDYLMNLLAKTREHESFSYGASPRAGIQLLSVARAWAARQGRDYVIPDDIQEVFHSLLSHRVPLSAEAEMQGITVAEILDSILKSVKAPRS